MMQLIDDYNPPFFFGSHYAQTIYPALFRKVEGLEFKTERIDTPDGDFLDLDWVLNHGSKKLAVVCHGLEGSSRRPYMKGMAKAFYNQGYSVLLWNFRSCGEELNRKKIFYHSGATYDLDVVMQHAAASNQFEHMVLVGFSLGGNLATKYLGETTTKPAQLKAGIAISVPINLSGSCDAIARPSNYLYSRRFLKSLKSKVLRKEAALPGSFDLNLLKKIDGIRMFDEHFTSVIHGFQDAEDYYTQNSSIHFIDSIKVPLLMINARNDSFLSEESFTYKSSNKLFHLLTPKAGGHCGFPNFTSPDYWSEQKAVGFAEVNI